MFKYESLGNDFILMDCIEQSTAFMNHLDWPARVEKACNRQHGIGADGILILKKQDESIEGLIFNSDGSRAERCLNGMRCLAHYLHHTRQFPDIFQILMGGYLTDCKVDDNQIELNAGAGTYEKPLTIDEHELSGHGINVGNPHFVVLKEITPDWLKKYGYELEHHKTFPNKTNIEFVWEKEKNVFQLLIHERGCGMTQACGTGAQAVMQCLLHENAIKRNEKIKLIMPGGELLSFINDQNETIQIATASPAIQKFRAKAETTLAK